MLRFSALVAVSALMLAACSQSGDSQPSTSSSQTSTQKTTAAGSACRSMGEGHKVNGKGQNDIYMCKVDVALNSAEAKSVHLVSYFDKVTKGGNEYECHIATFNSRVVLKGSFH